MAIHGMARARHGENAHALLCEHRAKHVDMRSCFAHFPAVSNPEKLAAHYASIGRKGGRKKSEAKRHAARLAALARWGHARTASIPVSDLSDRTWYEGHGRNSDLGLWDSRSQTFHVICITDFVCPEKYPEPGPRSVRLKQERHYDDKGGTFRPLRVLK